MDITTEELQELANILNDRMVNRKGGNNQRLAQMLGLMGKVRNENVIRVNIPSKDRSHFSYERYKYLLDAPFDISNKCCNIMKKTPSHTYHRQEKRNPIIATMASESKLRTQKWLENGCNGFNLKIPTSNPMSFWTEQDILLYIKMNNLPICSVYGDIVFDYGKTDTLEGQMTFSDLEGLSECGLFDAKEPPLKTTGCSRTGCVLCGFGCHLEKEGEERFLLLKETHPGFHNLLNYAKNNGVTYAEAIDWVNEHGNLNIKY